MTEQTPFQLPDFPLGSYPINLFSRSNALRCTEAFRPIDDWSEVDWAFASAAEVGLLCNFILIRRRGTPLKPKHLYDKIADSITCLDLLSSRLGAPLGEVLAHRFNAVSAQKACPLTLPRTQKATP